jgi:hypothetical protein
MSTEQVESLWSGLFDNSGQPLSGGKVYTYAAGTSTPKNLFGTQDQTLAAGNPITLDSFGRALVYGDGSYKFVVDDANDVTQYTMDNLTYGTSGAGGGASGGDTHWGGPSSGSGNNFTINPFPAVTGYVQGDRFTFIAASTNTGPVTLSVNGLAAIGIRRGPAGSVLTAGDIQAGNIVDVIYNASGPYFLPTNGTDFLLHLNPTDQGLLSPASVLTQGAGFAMTPNTTDGADLGYQQFGHLTADRGAHLVMYGNEHATGKGSANLTAGNVAGSAVAIRTTGPQNINLVTDNATRWLVDSTGKLLPASSNLYDIGAAANEVRNLYLAGDLIKGVGTWTPVFAAAGMTVTDITPSTADYCRFGPFMFIRLSINFTLGGAAHNQILITLPMTAAVVDGVGGAFGCNIEDGGGVTVTNGGRWRIADAGHLLVFKPGVPNFTLGVNAAINIQGFYRVV